MKVDLCVTFESICNRIRNDWNKLETDLLEKNNFVFFFKDFVFYDKFLETFELFKNNFY